MSWTDGIDDGGFGEFGGGYAGSPVDASVSGFGADLDGSYGGEVSAGLADAMAASVAAGNTHNTSALTRQQTTAVPVKDPWAPAKEVFRTFVTPGYVTALASIVGNPPQYDMNWSDLKAALGHMNVDINTYNRDLLAPSVPHNPHDRVMVEMAGADVQRGPAIGQTSGGLNYGPGWPIDENFYPGYGTNPFTGASAADPSDPYIRRRRGTEIVGMI